MTRNINSRTENKSEIKIHWVCLKKYGDNNRKESVNLKKD